MMIIRSARRLRAQTETHGTAASMPGLQIGGASKDRLKEPVFVFVRSFPICSKFCP